MVGSIDMFDNYTFVEVPREHADVVLAGDARCEDQGQERAYGEGEPEVKSILKLYLAYAIMPLGEKTKVFKVAHPFCTCLGVVAVLVYHKDKIIKSHL